MMNRKRIHCLFLVLFLSFSVHAQTYHELVDKAMSCALKDSLPQAEQLFMQALRMDPKNVRNSLLLSNLGTVQKRLGKTDEAIESYTMALNITPYVTTILLNRGTLYLDKGVLDKAYLDFCNVIDLSPENIEARLYRAYIYMEQRKYDEARIDYNVIVAKDAKHKSAHIGLVLLDQYQGKMVSARDGLNLLINDYPSDESLLKMRANLELAEDSPEAARADLEAATRIAPHDAELYCQLGDVFLMLKKKKEAKKAFEKAVQLGIPRSAMNDRFKSCK